MRISDWSSDVCSSDLLRSLALPHLHSLYRDTGYTVYLTVTDQGHAVQIERLPAPNRPQIQARWGGRWSLHCSSGGKVLLAFGAADLESSVAHRSEEHTSELQ